MYGRIKAQGHLPVLANSAGECVATLIGQLFALNDEVAGHTVICKPGVPIAFEDRGRTFISCVWGAFGRIWHEVAPFEVPGKGYTLLNLVER